MSDYDPDVTCGICGGQDPNEEHEVHDSPCVRELSLKWHKAEALAASRLELLREARSVTKDADGHWTDRVRWNQWVDKVDKELS